MRILQHGFFGAHTRPALGPPGVGKSRIVAQVAASPGVPLVDIRLSQMEPTDLRGIPFRNGARVEGSVYFTDAEGDLPDAAPDYPVAWVVKGRGTVPWESGYSSSECEWLGG